MEVVPIATPGFSHAFNNISSYQTKEGFWYLDLFKARHWHVESATNLNSLCKANGYAIDTDKLAFLYGEAQRPLVAKGHVRQAPNMVHPLSTPGALRKKKISQSGKNCRTADYPQQFSCGRI
jgi:hypothetical protein